MTLKPKTWIIKVPASTANIGPGFDTLGISLALYLEIQVKLANVNSLSDSKNESTQTIAISCEGYGHDKVSTDPTENLVSSTALFVSKMNNKQLPSMSIHCINNIPLGSGLGSSGSAVVAGACLANEVLGLKLSMNELLDCCLLIEGHPDNVAPSLFGGFVAAYMNEPPQTDEGAILKEVPSINYNTRTIGRHISLKISPYIKAVIATPRFPLPTSLARQVLPATYSRKDVVFNFQRLAVLTAAIGEIEPVSNTLNSMGSNSTVDNMMIYEAMKDVIHQPYRQHLIPGLSDILKEIHPSKYQGLLGVCISGAGPSVLALAVEGFDQIGEAMKRLFAEAKGSDGLGLLCDIRILDIDRNGLQVSCQEN